MSTSTHPEGTAPAAPKFHFDTTKVEWKPFVTEGCCYRILDVDVPARTADMIVKFEPNARCLHHRHVAKTMSLVLEGELHVIEKTADGKTRETVKPAGTFSADATNEVHVEGGGARGVVVYFSMRGETDHIYDFVGEDLEVKRAISIQDFDHDFRNWSSL
jgi:ChrR Cupin-like domain